MDGSNYKDKPQTNLSEHPDAHVFPADVTAHLPATAHLQSTLFDLARESLNRRCHLTGEAHNKNSVYHELNRIMDLNGYDNARLKNRQHITDKNLPDSWNRVRAHQAFALYGQAQSLLKLPPHAAAPSHPAFDKTLALSKTMTDAYAALRNSHDHLQASCTKETQTQGFIGRGFDEAKNTIGTSANGKQWYDPRRLWSNIFDSDQGSTAVQAKLNKESLQLDALRQAVSAKNFRVFQSTYTGLTGSDFDPSGVQVAPLKNNSLIADFDKSQKSGVDTTTDVASALAAIASLKCNGASATSTFLKATTAGALIGGTTKAGLEQLDGKYADMPRDFAVGALMGGTTPVSELAGSQASRFAANRLGHTVTGDLLTARIETQGVAWQTRLLSAALKTGTAGAVFGAVENPSREAITNAQEGKKINPASLAELSIKGAALGFVGGTALGGLSDRALDSFHCSFPGKLVVNAPKTSGDVEIPASGALSFANAAKLLKIKPEDFLTKATNEPFVAVHDAVRLYEKTGLNIQKVDPLSGLTVLPVQFADALSTVQNVDLLTSETNVTLAKKVEVVQATDTYIKENHSVVEDSLTRLTGDAKYRKLVRLKGQTGGEANEFDELFRSGLEKDLKTNMAVARIKDGTLSEADAFSRSTAETEAVYKQKTADFFKDMTNPAQRKRLNSLVDSIYAKFNPELVSHQDLQQILEKVPEKDRALAVALLHESADSCSDSVLTARLQALQKDLKSTTGLYSSNSVYTLAPDSSGNLLGYLYRKSNSISMPMHNIDALAERVKKGDIPESITLFDDISSTAIAPATRELLRKIPKVYVVDLGAFDKGVNIIDFARGPQAVSNKLDALLTESKAAEVLNTKLLPTAVARKILSDSVDEAASSIGPNVSIIRPNGRASGINLVAKRPVEDFETDVDELYNVINVPRASKEAISGFLSGYAGPDRELAAEMIAEGAVHNSFPVMIKKAVDLHQGLEKMLQDRGLQMKDLVMVSDKDPGGSSHLVTYLFGTANGMSRENFVSSRQLDQIITSGVARKKVLAYFDDTIYSGNQTAGMLESNIAALSPFKRVVVAGLGSYERGVDKIKDTHLGRLGRVDVASSMTHQPFYSEQHPFYSKLQVPQRTMVKTIGGAEGFGTIQGSIIWPYMYPDNNIDFFGSKFSGGVLHLPGP